MADPSASLTAIQEVGRMIHPFKGSVGTVILFTMFLGKWNDSMRTQNFENLAGWAVYMLLSYVVGSILLH